MFKIILGKIRIGFPVNELVSHGTEGAKGTAAPSCGWQAIT